MKGTSVRRSAPRAGNFTDSSLSINQIVSFSVTTSTEFSSILLNIVKSICKEVNFLIGQLETRPQYSLVSGCLSIRNKYAPYKYNDKKRMPSESCHSSYVLKMSSVDQNSAKTSDLNKGAAIVEKGSLERTEDPKNDDFIEFLNEVISEPSPPSSVDEQDLHGRSYYKSELSLKVEYLITQCNLIIRELKQLNAEMFETMKESDIFKKSIDVSHEGPVIDKDSAEINLTLIIRFCLEILSKDSIDVVSMNQLQYMKQVTTDAIARKISSQKVFSFAYPGKESWQARIIFIEKALDVIETCFMEVQNKIKMYKVAIELPQY